MKRSKYINGRNESPSRLQTIDSACNEGVGSSFGVSFAAFRDSKKPASGGRCLVGMNTPPTIKHMRQDFNRITRSSPGSSYGNPVRQLKTGGSSSPERVQRQRDIDVPFTQYDDCPTPYPAGQSRKDSSALRYFMSFLALQSEKRRYDHSVFKGILHQKFEKEGKENNSVPGNPMDSEASPNKDEKSLGQQTPQATSSADGPGEDNRVTRTNQSPPIGRFMELHTKELHQEISKPVVEIPCPGAVSQVCSNIESRENELSLSDCMKTTAQGIPVPNNPSLDPSKDDVQEPVISFDEFSLSRLSKVIFNNLLIASSPPSTTTCADRKNANKTPYNQLTGLSQTKPEKLHTRKSPTKIQTKMLNTERRVKEKKELEEKRLEEEVLSPSLLRLNSQSSPLKMGSTIKKTVGSRSLSLPLQSRKRGLTENGRAQTLSFQDFKGRASRIPVRIVQKGNLKSFEKTIGDTKKRSLARNSCRPMMNGTRAKMTGLYPVSPGPNSKPSISEIKPRPLNRQILSGPSRFRRELPSPTSSKKTFEPLARGTVPVKINESTKSGQMRYGRLCAMKKSPSPNKRNITAWNTGKRNEDRKSKNKQSFTDRASLSPARTTCSNPSTLKQNKDYETNKLLGVLDKKTQTNHTTIDTLACQDKLCRSIEVQTSREVIAVRRDTNPHGELKAKFSPLKATKGCSLSPDLDSSSSHSSSHSPAYTETQQVVASEEKSTSKYSVLPCYKDKFRPNYSPPISKAVDDKNSTLDRRLRQRAHSTKASPCPTSFVDENPARTELQTSKAKHMSRFRPKFKKKTTDAETPTTERPVSHRQEHWVKNKSSYPYPKTPCPQPTFERQCPSKQGVPSQDLKAMSSYLHQENWTGDRLSDPTDKVETSDDVTESKLTRLYHSQFELGRKVLGIMEDSACLKKSLRSKPVECASTHRRSHHPKGRPRIEVILLLGFLLFQSVLQYVVVQNIG